MILKGLNEGWSNKSKMQDEALKKLLKTVAD